MTEQLETVVRLSKDLALASATLSAREARYLVDAYYMIQHYRIACAAQVREMSKTEEPHSVLAWSFAQYEVLESQIKRALDKWTDSQPVGVWAKSICGIGPVIAAGLLAHIDIEKAPTVGHIWRFAGLDPTCKWNKGEKRPFNAELKTLCAFKLGESFVKVQNNEHDVYGKLFAARKREEEAKNDLLTFKQQAEQTLATRKIGKETDAYKALIQGRLPQAQIHARARRYAVKLFLSDYHLAAFYDRFAALPPKPYVFTHVPHHVHYRVLPNAEMFAGLKELLDVRVREILQDRME